MNRFVRFPGNGISIKKEGPVCLIIDVAHQTVSNEALCGDS